MKRFLIISVAFITALSAQAQLNKHDLSFSGTGDLTMPLGRYQIGTAINIICRIEGGWAELGGIYNIAGTWGAQPKVVYRGESDPDGRLKFYSYLDPASSGSMFLFATWVNQSPSQAYNNTVKLSISSMGTIEPGNLGSFSNALELESMLSINAYTNRVGIGTNNPSAKLEIRESDYNKIPFKVVSDRASFTVTNHTLSLKTEDPNWLAVPYIEWVAPNGKRQAYLGWEKDYFNLSLQNQYNFSINGGNVGIGSINPAEKLTVEGNMLVNGTGSYLKIHDRLTLQAASYPANDYTRSLISNNIRWNTSSNKWKVECEPWSDFSMVRFENGGSIGFYVRNINQPNYELTNAELEAYRRMKIDWNGNVSIGTDDSKGYKLAVNGDAIFNKVKVKQYGSWPDYVFHSSYKLLSLKELEQYIQQHKHLPDVPSAKEVEKEGLNLGDNQAVLLKKIEELTLYIIEQNRNIFEQNKKLEALQQDVEQLKKSAKTAPNN